MGGYRERRVRGLACSQATRKFVSGVCVIGKLCQKEKFKCTENARVIQYCPIFWLDKSNLYPGSMLQFISATPASTGVAR